MSSSLVTVLIPVYNGGAFLCDAVDSVVKQSCKNLEILILDDASTDQTADLAQEAIRKDNRIIYHRNTHNMGVASTRNKGFALARGEYIALLDADDCWLPNKLTLQLQQMEKQRLDICYTAYGFIDAAGLKQKYKYSVPENLTFRRLVVENAIGCSTALFRREIVDNIRMRDEYMHEDFVFWLELMKAGFVFGGINQPLVMYRKTEAGRSADKRKAAINRWKVLREFLKMPLPQSSLVFGIYALKGLYKHFLAKLFPDL